MSLWSNQQPRKYRVCYWDSDPKSLNAYKAVIESSLKQLGDVELYDLLSLEDSKLHPCDLIITSAQQVPEDHFKKWLQNNEQRIKTQAGIWVPVLILAKVSFSYLDAILVDAAKNNWYFDVLDPDHLDSLPIRIANLLRIHDHLSELHRYDQMLNKMQTQIDQLENQLAK